MITQSQPFVQLLQVKFQPHVRDGFTLKIGLITILLSCSGIGFSFVYNFHIEMYNFCDTIFQTRRDIALKTLLSDNPVLIKIEWRPSFLINLNPVPSGTIPYLKYGRSKWVLKIRQRHGAGSLDSHHKNKISYTGSTAISSCKLQLDIADISFNVSRPTLQ